MPDDARRMEAEEKYVAGEMTLRDLAKETGISLSALGKWSRERKWGKKRQKFREKALKKAVSRAADKKARELAKLLEASDEMEAALLTAARAIRENLDLDKNGKKVTDGQFRAGNLGKIAAAIGRQAETRLALANALKEDAQDKEGRGYEVRMIQEVDEMSS